MEENSVLVPDLFDFVAYLFGPPDKFRTVSNVSKKKHFFMSMRFLSIKHPVEVNNFNMLTINQLDTLTYFNMIMHRQYKVVPQWIKTPTKKTDTKKEKDFDKEIIEYFIREKEMNRRDFDFYRSMFPDECESYLTRIEKALMEKIKD